MDPRRKKLRRGGSNSHAGAWMGQKFGTHAPILLIHGVKDKVIPVSHAIRMKDAGEPESIRLWAIPEKGHSDCHLEPGFWELIETFLRDSL